MAQVMTKLMIEIGMTMVKTKIIMKWITNITELAKDLRKRTNLLTLCVINILYLSLFKS